MKKLIAYSSVAHMGFVTMGIFAATTQGIAGGIFQMVSHGIVSGALFLCVGVVYDRMHTREIAAYGGLVNRMPLYAAVFMVFTHGQCRPAGHLGLRRRIPDPDRHLQGQHLGRDARDARRHPVGRLCALALSQGGLRRARQAGLAGIKDLDCREIVIFAPLVVLTILFGVFPKPVLDMSAASVDAADRAISGRRSAPARPPPCW